MIDHSPQWTVELNPPCGSLHCPAGWSRTRENSLRLQDCELWLVWKGQGWMRTRERQIPLLSGFCALMRPGGIYDATHDEENPLGITYIHFRVVSPRKSAIASMIEQWPEFYQIEDLDYFQAATRRMVQLFNYTPRPAADLLKAVLSDLLQRSPLPVDEAPAYHTHRIRIAELIAAIQAQSDPLPSVPLMAKKMGLSAAHFSRVFHQVTGQSPREFLLHTRLMRARHLLTETDLSIAEIAERLDYGDVYFFSRQFKQKIGVPPSQYRRLQ